MRWGEGGGGNKRGGWPYRITSRGPLALVSNSKLNLIVGFLCARVERSARSALGTSPHIGRTCTHTHTFTYKHTHTRARTVHTYRTRLSLAGAEFGLSVFPSGFKRNTPHTHIHTRVRARMMSTHAHMGRTVRVRICARARTRLSRGTHDRALARAPSKPVRRGAACRRRLMTRRARRERDRIGEKGPERLGRHSNWQ